MTDRWVPISAFVAGLTIGALALHLMGYRPERTPAPTRATPNLAPPQNNTPSPFANQFPGLRMGNAAQQQVANQAVGQWRELTELYQQANREIDQYLSGNAPTQMAQAPATIGAALPPPAVTPSGQSAEPAPGGAYTPPPVAGRAPWAAYPPLPAAWKHPWRR
ncbi:MAG: hypothetical protein KatS3mg021_0527 [Fimbriimonadales bacterium]|jgi:hypothetical protein|nr:MAG: hypothetical protein KatS3mg021_0527 [Fimbriimonadales bacterium]